MGLKSTISPLVVHRNRALCVSKRYQPHYHASHISKDTPGPPWVVCIYINTYCGVLGSAYNIALIDSSATIYYPPITIENEVPPQGTPPR